jgi:hypothetical protein
MKELVNLQKEQALNESRLLAVNIEITFQNIKYHD